MKITADEFVEIYNKNRWALQRMAFSLLQDAHEAIDLMHDAFVSLAKHKNYEIIKLRAGGWLHVVCRNKCFHRIAKRNRSSLTGDMQDLGSADDLQETNRPQLIFNEMRSTRSITGPDPQLLGASPLEILITEEERTEKRGCLSTAMEALPSRLRDILELRYSHGHTYNELAEKLNISVGNVGFLINKAKNRLKVSML